MLNKQFLIFMRIEKENNVAESDRTCRPFLRIAFLLNHTRNYNLVCNECLPCISVFHVMLIRGRDMQTFLHIFLCIYFVHIFQLPCISRVSGTKSSLRSLLTMASLLGTFSMNFIISKEMFISY